MSKRLRTPVLFVHHRSELGGAPASLSYLIRELDDEQFEPHIYCPPGPAAELFRESGARQISVLKVDVEGSEREIFARNYQNWLPSVETIAVELHDAECRAVFNRAIADSNVAFELREVGELTVGVRSPVR